MSDHRNFDDVRLPDPDRLDQVIDEVVGDTGGPPDASTAEPGDAGDVVAALSRVSALAGEPVPDVSRARHLARIRTAAPAARRRPRRTVHWPAMLQRRLAPVGAAAAGLVLFAGSSTVAMAQDAGPDDALYGVKRVSEQVWAAVPRGQEQAAEVHLALANRRLGEARQAPRHAERLVAEGVADAEQASDELPGEAVETLSRLLGDGEGSLPAHASPAARAALHRNCVKIATKRGLDTAPCGPAPDFEHPGRGHGRGQLEDERPEKDSAGQGRGAGPEGKDGSRGRGWGPGGRPEGEEGPRGRGWGPGGRPEGEEGPRGRGWGPDGRPEGLVGPPPGVPSEDAQPPDTD